MNIGIISFAHLHAYSYLSAINKVDEVNLVAISDSDELRGQEVAQNNNTKYFKEYKDLLAEENIDAVIIASENVHHYEHVIAAANAGKHILCEKPISTSIEHAREMIKVCNEKNVIFQIAFPVRFNETIIGVKEIIDKGKIGKILAIKGTNRGTNPGGWFNEVEKSGGGAVIDHTVHVVDILRWIMKAEINEVYAEIDNLISEKQIDDCGILTMEFDNGVFATLDCSWSRNENYPTWGDVTLEIIGSEGTLTADAFGQKSNIYTNDKGVNWEFWGEDMDLELIKDFTSCVKEGKSPFISGEDGMKALEVALNAYKSSDNKEPVKI